MAPRNSIALPHASYGPHPLRAIAALLLAAAFAIRAPAQTPTPTPNSESQSAPAAAENIYVRALDIPNGTSLQVSTRTFKPTDVNSKAPTIHLVGAVHIGDELYYTQLQSFLDAQDLVLFEGVKPGDATSDLANANDAAKVKLTKSRQRTLAIMLERHRKKHAALPDTFDELVTKLPATTARVASSALLDAWGHPMQLIPPTPTSKLNILSLGADGAKGGDGAGADITFDQQKPLTKKEKAAQADGIQVQLAEALGLAFQLTSIDYTKPNWRNSDLTIDQVQSLLESSGASGEALFTLLDGSSFMGKLAGVMLNVVKTSPALAMTIKISLVETLANADMLAAVGKGGPAANQGMAQLMKVIIDDRNTEVLKDLRKVIDTETNIHSIAIFYGAGHFPEMEGRLTKDFGYTFSADQWFTAITLDLSSQPGAAAQAKQMREMIKRMAEQAQEQK